MQIRWEGRQASPALRGTRADSERRPMRLIPRFSTRVMASEMGDSVESIVGSVKLEGGRRD